MPHLPSLAAPGFLVTLVFTVLLLTAEGASAAVALRGVVRDPVGGAVAGAAVRATAERWEVLAHSDGQGSFTLALPEAAEVRVTVSAPGFVEARLTVAAARLAVALEVTLALASLVEQVSVTASRTEAALGSTPASLHVLSGIALNASPALALDETLRQVPGFTLYRRASSLTANPTSQGVSLRGLGASGASRALVLDDGIPLNDPFGGWVYWNRVPSALLDRVEIARGGASDLYGSGALGGVVHLVRTRPTHPFVRMDTSAGSMATRRLAVAAAVTPGPWTLLAGAEAQEAGGYVTVAPGERGAVDVAASSRYLAGDFSVRRHSRASNSLFLRAALFGESRGNGTRLQRNSTDSGRAAVGGERAVAGGQAAWRVHASRQVFRQSFSAIEAGRSGEQLTRRQRVPASAYGGSGQWAREWGRHLVVAGVEAQRVSGTTWERSPADEWQAETGAGGSQLTAALFAAARVAAFSSLSLTLSLRADTWRNTDGTGGVAAGGDAFASDSGDSGRRVERALSPRAGLVYALRDDLSLVASAYRAFRAPTLNELHRSFRVGNVLTRANDALGPERLHGVEGGLRYTPAPRLLVSARAFTMTLDGAIANITLSSAPNLIVRERRNLGRLASRGMELEGEARLGAWWLQAGYSFDSATVRRFPADPRLEGLRVPQQPRHALGMGVRVSRPWLGTAVLEGRWTSDQFDDDQNALRLAPCGVASATYARGVGRHLLLLASVENLLDARCEAGRTPVPTLAAPRSLRAGARLTWGQVLQ